MALHSSVVVLLKRVWRLTPIQFRVLFSRVRLALRGDFPIIQSPSYADDGLISQHVSDFLTNQKFMESYGLGEKTGALNKHPGDIHFRAYVACWAAKYASALEGDFVECGVGKGLLSRTIVNYLDFENVNKKLYLFDTFEGIPVEDATSKGERKNMKFLNETHFNSNYFEDVKRTFIKYKNVVFVKGRIPESFGLVTLDRISYISIDMNNAAAEISAIEYLWGKLVRGGVVVLDDYAYGPEFMSQKIAWDKFAAHNNFEILTLPTGQGLIIKNI